MSVWELELFTTLCLGTQAVRLGYGLTLRIYKVERRRGTRVISGACM